MSRSILKKQALFSFLDIAFHGRRCCFTIDRTNLASCSINVSDGFVALDDEKDAYGAQVAGTAAEGAPGVHIADLLIRMVRRSGVWGGKSLQRELGTTAIMISIHFEASLEYFDIIPLRQLTEISGSGSKPRHLNDIQRKEEMMQ